MNAQNGVGFPLPSRAFGWLDASLHLIRLSRRSFGAMFKPQLAIDPASAASNPTDGLQRRATIRVLLADDHKILRDGIASLLNNVADIEVVGQAEDGLMAVELARDLRPDVVVMDITMPRLNGIDATKLITEELPAVRVIGLSMHEETDMAGALHEAGAVAYLTKGGPANALIDAIRVAGGRATSAGET